MILLRERIAPCAHVARALGCGACPDEIAREGRRGRTRLKKTETESLAATGRDHGGASLHDDAVRERTGETIAVRNAGRVGAP